MPRSSFASAASRSAGPSLPAQPAALHRAVRRMSSLRLGLFRLSAISAKSLALPIEGTQRD